MLGCKFHCFGHWEKELKAHGTFWQSNLISAIDRTAK